MLLLRTSVYCMYTSKCLHLQNSPSLQRRSDHRCERQSERRYSCTKVVLRLQLLIMLATIQLQLLLPPPPLMLLLLILLLWVLLLWVLLLWVLLLRVLLMRLLVLLPPALLMMLTPMPLLLPTQRMLGGEPSGRPHAITVSTSRCHLLTTRARARTTQAPDHPEPKHTQDQSKEAETQ